MLTRSQQAPPPSRRDIGRANACAAACGVGDAGKRYRQRVAAGNPVRRLPAIVCDDAWHLGSTADPCGLVVGCPYQPARHASDMRPQHSPSQPQRLL